MTNSPLSMFIQLNGKKLIFWFLFTSVLLLSLVAIFVFLAYWNGVFLESSLLMNIILSAGLVIPISIMIISYFKWLIKRLARRKVFSKHPLNQLNSIGFHDSFSNVDNKWHLTEEIKAGRINDIMLTCDLCERKTRVLEFEAKPEWRRLDKPEFQRISKKFAKHNIEIGIGSFIKHIKIKTVHEDIQELRKELTHFTELLKAEGFRFA